MNSEILETERWKENKDDPHPRAPVHRRFPISPHSSSDLNIGRVSETPSGGTRCVAYPKQQPTMPPEMTTFSEQYTYNPHATNMSTFHVSQWGTLRQNWASFDDVREMPASNKHFIGDVAAYLDDKPSMNLEDCGDSSNSLYATSLVYSPVAEHSHTSDFQTFFQSNIDGHTSSSYITKEVANIDMSSGRATLVSQDSANSPTLERQDQSNAGGSSPVQQIKTKESHKMIEKKYRTRLNGYFGTLFVVVTKKPPLEEVEGKLLDRRVSKGKVLLLAIEHIRALELQCESLEKERNSLLEDNKHLRGNWAQPVSLLEALVKGPVTVAGDAGYALSPFTGMGTSIAFVGAYVLAGEISRQSKDIPAALKSYEVTLRPYAEGIQKPLPGIPWIANPQSAVCVKIFETFAWGAGIFSVTGIGTLLSWAASYLPAGKRFKLPEHETFKQ
ncbi:hypothetical protein BJ878DRAFT_480683 [Calycina marina]|uniref:BHLH domain-containing protein n=1 Tax=Calycina marina TaxID=1763456 RepID=A0A9P7Z1I5_9HELO|nr:hypothetical protein BJ878DRAFT_480683 [Calycina marina]